jgi:hypothetical protein
MNLELVPFTTREGLKIVVHTEELFEFDRLEAKPEYEQAFKYIKNCKLKPWPPHGLNSNVTFC